MKLDKEQLNQLFRYCYALTLHQDDAYDLMQSSLEKYLKQSTRALHSELAYLRKIVRNQFIDNTRRAKCVEFEALEDTAEPVAIDTHALDDLIINEEMVDLVWALLDTSEREIIFLWAIEGYTAAEISAELEIPRGTILSKIHRLRQKIQTKFDQQLMDTDEHGEVFK